METNTYSWLKSQKSQLALIAKKQIDVNNSIDFEKQNTDKLLAIIDRLEKENFKVLVIGAFSSGKSTFINALLGKKILPAKMLPSTAIICEIRYAEKIKCTLYPRQIPFHDKVSGNIHHGPFEIQPEDLKNYIVIDNKVQEAGDLAGDMRSNAELHSPFERMVLEWPLGICRDGVEIIDSPGLNDPNSHDKITLEYLPNTDAIIYCMYCAHSFTSLDKKTIEDLRNMGYRSIIFILTNFDLVQGTDEEAEFVAANTQKLAKLTDLGAAGVLFVNSLGGVTGKEKGDEEKLRKSNIPVVEQKVEEHLVNQKGKAKLVRGESEIRYQNQVTSNFVTNTLKFNSLEVEELVEKYEQLKFILDSAKSKSELMVKTLELGIVDITTKASNLCRLFLDSLDSKVAEWIADFTPSTKISLVPWKISDSVKANVTEYVVYVKSKMALEGTLWANEVLNPMIAESLKQISAATEHLQQSYEHLMENFQLGMNFGNLEKTEEELEPNPIFRFGALLYGVATGDIFGAGMGLTFGLKGLLSSLLTQITAGIIVGIVSLFTPVGWIGIVVAAIAAAIAAGAWNFNVIPGRIKKAITEKMQEALADREVRDRIISDTNKKIQEALSEVVENAKEMFKNDINPKENAMREALSNKEKGETAVMDENNRLAKAKTGNEEIKRNLDKFSLTIHV